MNIPKVLTTPVSELISRPKDEEVRVSVADRVADMNFPTAVGLSKNDLLFAAQMHIQFHRCRKDQVYHLAAACDRLFVLITLKHVEDVELADLHAGFPADWTSRVLRAR